VLLTSEGEPVSKTDPEFARRFDAQVGPNSIVRTLDPTVLAAVAPSLAGTAQQEKSFKIDVMKLAGSVISEENRLAVENQIENAKLNLTRDLELGTIGGKKATAAQAKLLDAIKVHQAVLKDKADEINTLTSGLKGNKRIAKWRELTLEMQKNDRTYQEAAAAVRTYGIMLAGQDLGPDLAAYVYSDVGAEASPDYDAELARIAAESGVTLKSKGK
jgi:hypothetical protein